MKDPHWGNTFLFFSSQPLPSHRLEPLKGLTLELTQRPSRALNLPRVLLPEGATQK